MRYASRFGIIFVFTLFSVRMSPSIIVENHWYYFFWALFVAMLNAAIRSVLKAQNASPTWTKIIIFASALNLLLYTLVYFGATSWLGLTTSTYGSALLAALVVTVVSSICNHFIRIRNT